MPTIDATKGGASANSYVTAQEADTYWDEMFGASEWADLSGDDKARLLIMATRMIDRWSVRYGSASTTQALNYPLDTRVAGIDGFLQAKQACIHQAYYLFKHLDVIEEGGVMGVLGTRQESIGPTSKTVTGLNSFKKYDPEMFRLLHPFIEMDFFVQRG